MIDATPLKAHRVEPRKAGDDPRLIGHTKGGMNRCPAGHLGTKCPEGGKLPLATVQGARSACKGVDRGLRP